MAIPKTIHYCWFGRNPLDELSLKCIESWKKYCPDYEIVKWTEDNYDVTKNKYMYDAYINKKWGFVPDYARLDIIYEHSGIYLDTDVEIIRNFDGLLENTAFVGFEDEKGVNFGSGFGAEKGLKVIKKIMREYEKIEFIKQDGSLNLTPSPKYQTDYLLKNGLKLDNSYQKIDGITIYPTEYFNPKDWFSGKIIPSNNTYSIHHFNASWLTTEEHVSYRRQKFFVNIFGKTAGRKINIFWEFPKIVIKSIKKNGIMGFCAKVYNRCCNIAKTQ